ncbi:hypothetical protein GCM10010284_22580 [Streptomyces rubiginosohelvolus]|nr:hypothetical protein GCM10010284_22580 [Streptomyces rubiginosohelvolus]
MVLADGFQPDEEGRLEAGDAHTHNTGSSLISQGDGPGGLPADRAHHAHQWLNRGGSDEQVLNHAGSHPLLRIEAHRCTPGREHKSVPARRERAYSAPAPGDRASWQPR